MFTNTEQLEERLSRPSAADVEAARKLEGGLVILGAGGKMGPTLALRARRAGARVIAVSRFGDDATAERLAAAGVEIARADLLDREALRRLPDAPNVVFMAGRKFGTAGAAHSTWAMNVLLPALAADRYATSRFVVFSSGNVYPLRRVAEGGAREDTPPEPVGEYAQSVLGRERIFEYFAERHGTKSVLLRLNYAVETRYGVLVDIARQVLERRPIDVTMGSANVIWQGDANSVALRAFELASAPPAILNLTGPETVSIRRVAEEFGREFGVAPRIEGKEAETALLNDAAKCHRLFGYPAVSAGEMIEWIAAWMRAGGGSLGKPTHFEARDGRF